MLEGLYPSNIQRPPTSCCTDTEVPQPEPFEGVPYSCRGKEVGTNTTRLTDGGADWTHPRGPRMRCAGGPWVPETQYSRPLYLINPNVLPVPVQVTGNRHTHNDRSAECCLTCWCGGGESPSTAAVKQRLLVRNQEKSWQRQYCRRGLSLLTIL
jgi:hypothetical protein